MVVQTAFVPKEHLLMDDIVSDFSKRKHNFNAGPAALPLSVIEQLSKESIVYQDTGVTVQEMSHRSAPFKRIIEEVEQSFKSLLSIPDTHDVIFSQGGGTGQTAAVIYNLVEPSGWGAYAVTGSWSKKAYEEAGKLQANRGLLCSPSLHAITSPKSWGKDIVEECFSQPEGVPDMVYHCSNETIHGLEYSSDPRDECAKETYKSSKWVMDASSNFCSRPIKVSNYDVIYAGAQKNMGTSGITVVVGRKSTLQTTPKRPCPSILDYSVLLNNRSLHNTIPVYPLRVTGLCARWNLENGGLNACHDRAIKKSKALYNAIDSSDGYYVNSINVSDRSRMNIVFNLSGGAELEDKLVVYAAARGIIGIKGHRLLGGLRASCYNAVTEEAVDALLDCLEDFKNEHPL